MVTRYSIRREERYMSDIGKTIATNVRAIRRARGFTLQEVADRAGMAKSYVWEIERGANTNPTISALLDLGRALGCSLSDMCGTETYMKPALRPEAMKLAVEVDRLLRAALAKGENT